MPNLLLGRFTPAQAIDEIDTAGTKILGQLNDFSPKMSKIERCFRCIRGLGHLLSGMVSRLHFHTSKSYRLLRRALFSKSTHKETCKLKTQGLKTPRKMFFHHKCCSGIYYYGPFLTLRTDFWLKTRTNFWHRVNKLSSGLFYGFRDAVV